MNEDDLKLFTAIMNTGHASVAGTAQSGASDAALRRVVDRHYPAIYAAPRTGMSTSLVLPGLLDFGKKKR